MAGTEKYNIHLMATNIGPHENLNQVCDAGENGPIRIGVYASNGGGKSSLSRQFRLLEIDRATLPPSNKYITLGKNQGAFKFKLFRQDNPVEKHEFEIAHSNDKVPSIKDSSDLIFHVFNNDYVRESIEPLNYGQDKEIEGYIIGKDVVDLTKEKSELDALRNEYEVLKGKIESLIKSAQSELRQIGIRANTTEYASIIFDNIINNHHNPQEGSSYKELRALLKKLEGIPDDLADVPSIINNFGSDSTFLQNILTDLQENVSISKLSEAFKAKVSAKENFIREGMVIVGDNRVECPFCEQSLGTEQLALIDDFVSYLNDAETLYKNKLRQHIANVNLLKDHLCKKYNEFIKIESLFNRNKEYFPSYKGSKITIPLDPAILFEQKGIEDILNNRIVNITQGITNAQIETILKWKSEISQYIETAIKNATNNNGLIEAINNTKRHTNNETLSLKKRICNAKYMELKSSLKEDIEKLHLSVKNGKEKAVQIQQIESKAKKFKKDAVIDTFNNLMSFIFADKYIFNKEHNSLSFKDYSLKTKAHDVLSDGEKNVIAFCYYVAETHALLEQESDYDKLFFVIDDPISSMDFHYAEYLNDYMNTSLIVTRRISDLFCLLIILNL